MKVTLNAQKSGHQNAVDYFDKAKKLEGKVDKIHAVIADAKAKIDALPVDTDIEEVVGGVRESAEKAKWYEKFRWFKTHSGLLAVGGRDAQTNETIVKKHVDPNDVVFHTELPGSPFFVLKSEDGKPADPLSLEEVGQVVAAYSKAWKDGHASATVFWVNPDQVSKTANSGESMGTGSFMIRGTKNFLQPKVELCVGLDESGTVIVGSRRGLKMQGLKESQFVRLVPGREKSSSLAKILRKQLNGGDLDAYVRMIPAGGSRIAK